MAKYRKIGTDRVNEAWQIGSSEHKPEWTRGWWSKPEELGVENGDYLVHSSKRDYAENASLPTPWGSPTSIQTILLMVKRTKFETEWIKVDPVVKPTDPIKPVNATDLCNSLAIADCYIKRLEAEIAALKDRNACLRSERDALQARTVDAERDRDALRTKLATWRSTLEDANHAIQYLARSDPRCECDEDVGQSLCLDYALRQAARNIAWLLASDADVDADRGLSLVATLRARLTTNREALEESRGIITNLFRSAFGRDIPNWINYAPKLTAAIASYDLVNEARDGPTPQGAPTTSIEDD